MTSLGTRVAATAVACALLSTSLVASAGQPAAAASASDWDPGFIVSDQQFYDGDAMTEAEIQAFLNAKVPVCDTNHPAEDSPFTCLKEFRQTTVSVPADAYCGAYVGGTNETAARIISKVALACNISPKALIVMLQKEQGLVTNTWPSQFRYDKAMGFGCFDTAACDATYKGFFNQVYLAAKQFQRYRLNPSGYNHRIGYNSIHYQAPVKIDGVWTYTCPSVGVTIRNAATAGLYNYTPYTPNAAALSNLYGTGDSCSAYGNRNFWRYWSDWFGDPHASGALVNATSSNRIAGSTRYGTAAALSASFSAGTDVVYIASGQDYPDALAIAPAAAAAGAPLLLVTKDKVPAETAAELARLAPQRIVVVGGPGAVSNTVYNSLAQYSAQGAAGLSRLGGSDRYETARIAVRAHWAPGSASTVYIVTGKDFPDALSAATAAGAQNAPVISVNGSAARLDAATASLITELGATRVVIAGGSAVVSEGIKRDLAALPGVTSVVRTAGSDRYETSAALNSGAFDTATHIYLAYGKDFPDALAGAVTAGIDGAPLYLVQGSCIPRSVAASGNSFGPVEVTLVGGTGVLPMNLTTVPLCP